MIELKKIFKGDDAILYKRNCEYSGYVSVEGELIINMDFWDGRMANYKVTISGPALKKLISQGMKALDTITGYEHTMQVKVK